MKKILLIAISLTISGAHLSIQAGYQEPWNAQSLDIWKARLEYAKTYNEPNSEQERLAKNAIKKHKEANEGAKRIQEGSLKNLTIDYIEDQNIPTKGMPPLTLKKHK